MFEEVLNTFPRLTLCYRSFLADFILLLALNVLSQPLGINHDYVRVIQELLTCFSLHCGAYKLDDFYTIILRFYKDGHANGFFPDIARLWTSFPGDINDFS